LLGQLVVSRQHRLGGAVLQSDQPASASRLVENHTQELRGPTFGLAKAGHQQPGKGDEPWPGLSARHSGWQRATGEATARTDQSVPLIFRDDRLNVGKFPDLMAEGIGIDASQHLAATSALGRYAQHHFLTLLRGNQSPLVFVMAWLAAA
jgi:hypothetical protein